MATAYILYNKKAGASDSMESVKNLEIILDDEIKYIDVTQISNYDVFLSGLDKDDYVILAGGDGTLNWFINRTDGVEIHNEILYFPNGTGNDFANDLGHTKECNPFSITEHIKNLPSVVVNGKKYRFINGIGYGIDGYCCEVGDALKKIPGKRSTIPRLLLRDSYSIISRRVPRLRWTAKYIHTKKCGLPLR